MLNGRDLAEYIQERQAREVRSLRQAWHVQPKLAIILTGNHAPSELYVRKKQQYGAEVLVAVEVHRLEQSAVPALISELNNDSKVHGIIVQLPLQDPTETDAICNLIAPEKDVDALGERAVHDPATPMAILWLLAGYNVDVVHSKIALVGRGRLVGAPLEKMFTQSGYDFTVVNTKTPDIAAVLREADIVISATGRAGLITADMIKKGAVVVDAGVAGEKGKTVGDLDASVYERDDLTLTPRKGGVGPLTICALFENVIRAARATVKG